jgi:DNA replication protein DnaC
MSLAIQLLKVPQQVLTTLCPTHTQPLIQMGSQLVCKTCAKESLEQAKLQHQQELEDRLLQKRIHSSGINDRYLNSGFSNYVTSVKAQVFALECCQKFTAEFLKGATSNLILHGTPGSGKTHLGSAIIRNILHRSHQSARYVTTAHIAQTIMNSWSIADQSEEQWINFYADFDLLVIDEYGLHDRHTTRLELIHKVLYRRYDLMKPTVIISNFTLDTLENDLGMRLWSRLHENHLITVPCYWSDHRMK